MRLADDPRPSGRPIEHDPVSYFNALVDLQQRRVDGDSATAEQPPAPMKLAGVFRDASKRAVQRFAEARERLAA